MIVVSGQIAFTVYELVKVDRIYKQQSFRYEQWRYDVIFFLVMNISIIIFIMAQYFYLGFIKKSDVVEDAEEEEINFIIKNF